MSAFFFGPAAEQLFGYYHTPRRGDAGAVVLCPSWGLEYQYAHRALRVLAQRLAERGYHVMRFDYSGTGDSWGDTTDADIERWECDLDLAIRELQGLSGRAKVDLIGLRIGAAVAAQVARSRRDVARVVLWDPVVNGEAWVQLQSKPSGAAPTRPETDRSIGLGPFRISPRLLDQLRTIGPSSFGPYVAERVLLLETQDPAATGHPALSHVSDLHHELLLDASPWVEDVAIWAGQIPAKAARRIAEWFPQ